MAWPMITNVFCSVLISTNLNIREPESIHNDLIVDGWIDVFAAPNTCRIMSPKETAKYWQAELYAWDEYGMTLSEWGVILYKYRLRSILHEIEGAIEEYRELKEEVQDEVKELIEMQQLLRDALEEYHEEDVPLEAIPIEQTE